MKYSVIIPSLNSKMVDRTICSILDQKDPGGDFEIIVVGQDPYGLVHENPIVKFVRTAQPTPPAKARNLGASLARGNVLVFIDADCIASAYWLATFSSRYIDSEVSVVGGGVTFDTENYWTLADNLSMFHEVLSITEPGVRSILPSLNLSVRKEAFWSVGGFDEAYPRPSGEDANLSIKLGEKGHRLVFEPSASVLHLPPRTSARDLCRHGYYQGKYSTKMRQTSLIGGSFPALLKIPFVLALLSPVIALAAAVRVYARNNRLWRFWYCFPAIALNKLFWCFGGAAYPKELR